MFPNKRYAEAVSEADAVKPTRTDYDETGVDLWLIRRLLGVTPAERPRVNDYFFTAFRGLNAPRVVGEACAT